MGARSHGVLVWGLLVAAACTSDDETVALVFFDAEEEALARAESIRIRVYGTEGDLRLDQSAELSDRGTPLPLGVRLRPEDGDASRTYRVLGELKSTGGATTSIQTIRCGYLADEAVEIRLRFDGACVDNLSCGAGLTCVEGACAEACCRLPIQSEVDGRTALSRCGPDGADGGVAPCDEASMRIFYRDGDGDGIGRSDDTITGCVPPEGYVDTTGDCDDSNRDIPTDERCNMRDDDCDGDRDEDAIDATRYFRDSDSDSYGDPNVSVLACPSNPPSGYVTDNGDCNDSDRDEHPGVREICDGRNNTCSKGGGVDTTEDADGDGYAALDADCEGGPFPKTDCRDDIAIVNPGRTGWFDTPACPEGETLCEYLYSGPPCEFHYYCLGPGDECPASGTGAAALPFPRATWDYDCSGTAERLPAHDGCNATCDELCADYSGPRRPLSPTCDGMDGLPHGCGGPWEYQQCWGGCGATAGCRSIGSPEGILPCH